MSSCCIIRKRAYNNDFASALFNNRYILTNSVLLYRKVSVNFCQGYSIKGFIKLPMYIDLSQREEGNQGGRKTGLRISQLMEGAGYEMIHHSTWLFSIKKHPNRNHTKLRNVIQLLISTPQSRKAVAIWNIYNQTTQLTTPAEWIVWEWQI